MEEATYSFTPDYEIWCEKLHGRLPLREALALVFGIDPEHVGYFDPDSTNTRLRSDAFARAIGIASEHAGYFDFAKDAPRILIVTGVPCKDAQPSVCLSAEVFRAAPAQKETYIPIKELIPDFGRLSDRAMARFGCGLNDQVSVDLVIRWACDRGISVPYPLRAELGLDTHNWRVTGSSLSICGGVVPTNPPTTDNIHSADTSGTRTGIDDEYVSSTDVGAWLYAVFNKHPEDVGAASSRTPAEWSKIVGSLKKQWLDKVPLIKERCPTVPFRKKVVGMRNTQVLPIWVFLAVCTNDGETTPEQIENRLTALYRFLGLEPKNKHKAPYLFHHGRAGHIRTLIEHCRAAL